jgi:CRISPR type IV-associated protein Csf3
MLGADAAGLSKMAGYGVKKGVQAGVNRLTRPFKDVPPSNESRRKFIGDAAALGTAGAIAASIPSVVRNIGEAAATVAPKVADNVAVAAVKPFKFNTLQDYLIDVARRSEIDMTAFNKSADDALAEGYSFDEIPDISYNDLLDKNLKNDAWSYDNAKVSAKSFGGREAQLKYYEAKTKPSYYDNRYTKDEIEFNINQAKEVVSKLKNDNHLEQFSPQAKAEMKVLKEEYGDNWSRYLAGEKNVPRKADIPAFEDDPF